MHVPAFYRSVDPQLSQGDILERVPHLFLKEAPRPLRKATLPGGRAGYELEELLPGPVSSTAEAGILVPASCQVTRAMLLTYDCEIDKDNKHRLIVLIRPLPESMPAADRAIIRENRRYPFFYLPEGGERLPESYVDFRRITTASPQVIDPATRLTSLTQVARRAMVLQFFRFLARIEIAPDLFEP